jgi:hypothetical protein
LYIDFYLYVLHLLFTKVIIYKLWNSACLLRKPRYFHFIRSKICRLVLGIGYNDNTSAFIIYYLTPPNYKQKIKKCHILKALNFLSYTHEHNFGTDLDISLLGTGQFGTWSWMRQYSVLTTIVWYLILIVNIFVLSIIGNATTKNEEFLWGKAINQSVLMKWKYRGFLNKPSIIYWLGKYYSNQYKM